MNRLILLTGPARSGKTHSVVQSFREASNRRDSRVRLLVPTATMARHLQNSLAREGLIVRPGMVQTLSRFVTDLTAEVAEVSDAFLSLVVEEAARRVARPEFSRVVHTPGFANALARTIAEFSSARCGPESLERNLPRAPLAEAFLAVYRETLAELGRRGLMMRAARLEHAAETVARDGPGEVHTLWLDGFQNFSDPELAVIEALGRHASVTVTLATGVPDARPRERLLAMGFQEQVLSFRAPEPAPLLFEAPTVEREADEIVRRILVEIAGGRAFRDIGIIVRNCAAYEPVLRLTLGRYGIPARFYFDGELAAHAVTRLLAGAVDAMLGGWDHEAVLEVLRLAPGLARHSALDRFDFAVRARTPGRGLASLRALTDDERVLAFLDRLGKLEGGNLEALPDIFRFARPEPEVPHATAAVWAEQAAALEAFAGAIAEARAYCGAAAGFNTLWRVAKSILRLTPLRAKDDRRNAVHVIEAHEARQWQLPVVFVCGLVEKQFPAHHAQDPFFPDAARLHLQNAGFRLRAAAEFEREERFLFDMALSRASSRVILSYPRNDGRGEQLLRSLFLDDLAAKSKPAETRPVRPAPRHGRPALRPAVAIQSTDLLQLLESKFREFTPSGLEKFLECPFGFFVKNTLKLEEPPKRPEQRLDHLLQGTIVHEVLAQHFRNPMLLDQVFDDVFDDKCGKEHVPDGYLKACARRRLWSDIERFIADRQWPSSAFAILTEQDFSYDLDRNLRIKGRVDRLDTATDGRAFVIDYKYSNNVRNKLKDENLLQAPLYFLAIGRFFRKRPAGMFYCALREKVEYAGWGHPGGEVQGSTPTAEWTDAAIVRSREAAADIRGGLIRPQPSGDRSCRYCAALDICRAEIAVAEAAAP